MYRLLVLLVVAIVAYILVNKKKISQVDLTLLVTSTIALLWKSMHGSASMYEMFVDKDTNMLQDEEDVSAIQDNLLRYYTVFNSKSYKQDEVKWISAVNSRTWGSSLSVVPSQSFHKAKGVQLGGNPIIGPLSNRLNISFNNPYTIALVFRHGNLQSDPNALGVQQKNDANRQIIDKMSILKLFANSPNNNGVELFIDQNSLKMVNNVQFGKLMFQFANYQPVVCRLSPNDDFISIIENTLCFFFIVRSESTIRVLYTTTTDGSLREIVKFVVPTNDVTFSNKEMIINQTKNWNAFIYNVGIFGTALTDATLSTFFTHIKSIYTKVSDPNYGKMLQQYKKNQEKLSSFVKCTMDETVCSKCTDIKEWNNITQILNAPKECTSAINAYCSMNPTHKFCECWDESSAVYTSNGCKTLRGALANEKTACLSNLTKKEIKKYLKKDKKKHDETKRKNKSLIDNDYTVDKVIVKYGDELLGLSEVQQNNTDKLLQDYNQYKAQENKSFSSKLLNFFGL